MPVRLLLIEDNPDHALLTKRIIRDAGRDYELAATSTAQEGLDSIFKNDYDLVLCDYRLSGYTALDILSHARENGFSLPFVIITSAGNEKIAVEAMKKGAYDYVVKDHAYEEVLPMVVDKSLERYHFQEEKENLKRELVESERKYRSIFDNANDAIFVADVETQVILDTNKQGEKLINRTKKEIQRMSWFDLYPAYKAELYRSQFEAQVRDGGFVDADTEIVCKDSSIIPVYVSASVVEIGKKKVIQGIFKNMTDYKKLEEQLIQSGKMAAMGQLAAGISHELNQPLTGIKGFAQAIMMDLDEDNPIKEDLRKIEKQSERMDQIIRNIRSFAQRAKFKLEAIDVNRPIEDSLGLLGEQLRLHNIKLEARLAPGLPKIEGDINQLQQVFLNFITNARDAIDSLNVESGGALTIITELDSESNQIKVVFADTGGGIKKSQLTHIFNPFYTTKSPGGGMGLGLSICYRIIRDHHATIKVDSKLGVGTTFTLNFPAFAKRD